MPKSLIIKYLALVILFIICLLSLICFSRYVDFVSMMGYDYHIFWPYLPFTGYNAPLFKSKNDKYYFATMNIQWSADYWVKKGMPKEKLVIGIPTYGRTWK